MQNTNISALKEKKQQQNIIYKMIILAAKFVVSRLKNWSEAGNIVEVW